VDPSRPDYDALDFFTDASLIADPYPYYEHLRAKCPVHRHGQHEVVLVTGFEQGVAIYGHPEHYSSVNAVNGPLPPLPFSPEGDDITAQLEAHRSQLPMAGLLVTLDRPDHAPLRSFVVQLFAPSRLRRSEPAMLAIADRLIDEFADTGAVELVRDFGVPFAGLVIADLLGVPQEDRAWFREMFAARPRLDQVADRERYNPLSFLDDKFTEYMLERRARPRDDVLSEIANATLPGGGQPSLEQVVSIATFLFGAGQDTTAKLLASAMRILAERPDIQRRVRADPGLIPAFIEETLRFDGPLKTSSRLVRKSTEMGGVALRAGTHVALLNGAMNRDPGKFEAPDEFRLDRPGVREHLSFGRGPHTCPGAQLARNEVRISLERLLDRMGDIRLSEEHHGPAGARRYRHEPGYVLRGVRRLNLEFEPIGTARPGDKPT
jgi:cytochrome P450